MNGNVATFLLWAANVVLGLLFTLIGFIVREHQRQDEAHRSEMSAEILRLRNRLHDLTGQVMKIDAEQRASKD